MTAAMRGGPATQAAARREERAVELYEQGLTTRQAAEQLAGVPVGRLSLPAAGWGRHEQEGTRCRDQSPWRHLQAVSDVPSWHMRPLDVPPGRAAIAYSADRGWHMVQAPPGWFLELLAEVD